MISRTIDRINNPNLKISILFISHSANKHFWDKFDQAPHASSLPEAEESHAGHQDEDEEGEYDQLEARS